MKSKITLKAIILRTTKYSESSVMINAFSQTQGSISILAKGIRKKPQINMIQRLNELELVLYEPAESGIYLFAECTLLKEHARYDSVMNMACAEAGLELVSGLMIPADDSPEIYNLLTIYLEYVRGITNNEIALFWRFALRILRELGVPLDPRRCGSCHCKDIKPAGYDHRQGLIVCETCLRKVFNMRPFLPETRRLLYLLPEIGKHLDGLRISVQSATEINDLLLRWLEGRFHKRYTLHSIQVALQLLRIDQNGSN